ncbi:hypothetical protein NQ318_010664 [Aromia moschata]|uniref:Cytochrome P450 n=1 Tax=Aromia moschata TaxID=1265417 RepID=A0AAV8XSS4_9CUCU|nr:hypothetical protein NQ318_010664 [Aromia moschata]
MYATLDFVYFETSSTTMIYAMYELDVNQDDQENLREEIRNVLEKHDNNIIYEAVMEMTFLDKIINIPQKSGHETLRLHPPIAGTQRISNKPYPVPGTNFVLEPVIKMDPQKYPDPERFNPERFSEEKRLKDHLQRSYHLEMVRGHAYCIGQRFGVMRSKVGLIRMIKNFRVTLNGKTKTPIEEDPMTNLTSVKGGVWLNVARIENDVEVVRMADTINTIWGLLTIFLGICIYILWFFRKSFNYWKHRGVDFLEPTIPFGNAADLYMKRCTFGELFSNFYLQLKERGCKHGGAYFFWKPVYIPVDPDIIKKILISDFENFPNHGLYISEKNDPLSGHIFNMEGAKWRNFRAKMPANFTTAKMRKMFLIMERLTKQFNRNLKGLAESGVAFDIKNETTRFTTDVITACAFGTESNTMQNKNEELLKEGRYFFDYQWNLYKNTAVMMVPRKILQMLKFRIMPKSLEKFFMGMCRTIVDYRKNKDIQRGDITDSLMRLMEKDQHEHDFSGKYAMEPLNFGEFSAQMLVFFAAGFETSSSTQSFAVYELARNRECQAKLREEINRVLEKHGNNVTYDAVMEMKYLENVIDETLRLYPVFPILPRHCLNDYKVPGTDFTLEKDTLVMITNMGIQRDPEYYPNPDQFDPERFSDEYRSARPFVSHVPFGEGPRICVGKRFGLLQTNLGLITMVRNYDIYLNEEKTTPGFKFEPKELILRKTGNIWVNLRRISS